MTTTMGATTANVAHGLVDAAVDAEGEAISSGGNLIDDLVESVGARAAAALMIGGYRSRAAPGIEMDGVLGSAAVAPEQYAENGDRCRRIDAHRPQHDRELALG